MVNNSSAPEEIKSDQYPLSVQDGGKREIVNYCRFGAQKVDCVKCSSVL